VQYKSEENSFEFSMYCKTEEHMKNG